MRAGEAEMQRLSGSPKTQICDGETDSEDYEDVQTEDYDFEQNLGGGKLPPTKWERFRSTCLFVVSHKWFEALILALIVANCVLTIALTSAGEEEDEWIEKAFGAVFLVEMLLKWVAWGLWVEQANEEEMAVTMSQWNLIQEETKKSSQFKDNTAVGAFSKTVTITQDKRNIGYFQDGWNVLDFAIVIPSFIVLILPNAYNFTSLRLLRILRPLRTIKRVEGMKLLAQTVVDAFPLVLEAMFLILFIMIVFTILGLQMFNGVLHFRCYHPRIEEVYPNIRDEMCCDSKYDEFLTMGDALCDGASDFCDDGYLCLGLARNPLPAGDFGSFDNVFYSFIQVFIISTSGAFSDTLYLIWDAYSVYCWIYFVSLSFVITFFVINLVLAVVDYVFNLRLSSGIFIPDDPDPVDDKKKTRGSPKSLINSSSRLAEGDSMLELATTPKQTCTPEPHKISAMLSDTTSQQKTDLELDPKYALLSDDSIRMSRVGPSSMLQHQARHMSSITAPISESFPKHIAELVVENLLVRMDILKQSKEEKFTKADVETGWRVFTVREEPSEELELLKEKWLDLFEVNDEDEDEDENELKIETEEDLIEWFWEANENSPEGYSQMIFKLIMIDKLLILDQMDRCQKQAWIDFNVEKKHHIFAKAMWKRFDRELNLAGTYTNLGDATMDQIQFDEGLMGLHASFETEQRLRIYEAVTKEKRGNVNYYHLFGWLQDRENYMDTMPYKLKLAAILVDPADAEIVWKTRHGTLVKKANKMVNSGNFKNFIFLLILLNTILLAAKWPGQTDETDEQIESINAVFTWIFTMELVVRIFAKGFRGFTVDPFNQFDGIIVIISLVDFIIFRSVGVNDAENSLSFLTALRALRLLRVFRLLQRFRSCRVVLQVIMNVTVSVFFVLGILFIFDFMFASLGMSWFKDKLKTPDFQADLVATGRTQPRWHFDNFIWSMVTVFQILANDSWHVLLYDFAQVQNEYLTFAYFFLVVVFSTAVFFPLFMSLLLSQIGIGLNSTIQRLLQKKERQRRKYEHIDKMHGLSFCIFTRENKIRQFCHTFVNNVYSQSWTTALIVLNIIHMFYNGDDIVIRDLNNNFLIWDAVVQTYMLLEILMQMIAFGVRKRGFDSTDPELEAKLGVQTEWLFLERKKLGALFEKLKDNEEKQQKLVNETEKIIHPLKIKKKEFRLETIDIELTGEPKTLNEGLHKISRKGLKLPSFPAMITRQTNFQGDEYYENPNAFFARKWNIFDTILVVASFLCILIPYSEFAAFLRCFRPLRLIGRVRKVNVVFISLARAVPPVVNTLGFGLLFWFIIAVVGMHLFQDRWNYCHPTPFDYFADPRWSDFDEMSDYYKYNVPKDDCNFSWFQPEFNYDHIFQAYHTTLYLSTVSGFADVMYLGVDAPTAKYDHQYIDRQPLMALYFIFAVVFGGFFTINLMSSVVINTFNSIREEKQSAILTGNQREWVEKSTMVSLVPRKIPKKFPQNKIRKACFNLCEKQWFEIVILSGIFVNTLCFGLIYFNMSDDWKQTLFILEIFFVVVFSLEAILKILGYRFGQYIEDHWNKFDFALVWIGLFGIVFHDNEALSRGPSLTLLRFFRVARLFRLVQRMSTLKMLFVTIIISIPFVWNIALYILVFMTMFAFLGLLLFGGIDRSGSSVLNDKVNFDDMSHAYLLLYRLAQRDGWGAVYEGFLSAVGNTENYRYDYFSPQTICFAYFFPFFFMVCVIYFDLFIAVVLEMFAKNLNSQQDLIKLKKEGITEYQTQWLEMDKLKGYQKLHSAPDFLEILLNTPGRIGFARRFRIKTSNSKSRKRASSSLSNLSRPQLTRLRSSKKATKSWSKAELKEHWKDAWKKFFYFRFEVERETDDGEWMVSYDDALFGISESMNREIMDPLFQSTKPGRTLPIWRWFVEHYLPENLFNRKPDIIDALPSVDQASLFERLEQFGLENLELLIPEDADNKYEIKMHYLLAEPVFNQEKESRYKYEFRFKECVENLLENDNEFKKYTDEEMHERYQKEELILWYFNKGFDKEGTSDFHLKAGAPGKYRQESMSSNELVPPISPSANYDLSDSELEENQTSTQPPTFHTNPYGSSNFSFTDDVSPRSPVPPDFSQSQITDDNVRPRWHSDGGHVNKKTSPTNQSHQVNDPTRTQKQNKHRPPTRTATEPRDIHALNYRDAQSDTTGGSTEIAVAVRDLL